MAAAPPPAPPPSPPAPRIQAIHPLLVGALPAYDDAFARAAALGFDTVLLAPVFAPGGSGSLFLVADHDRPHPVLEASGDADSTLSDLAARARAHGLALWLDLVTDRLAAEHPLVQSRRDWFEDPAETDLPDPRRPAPEPGTCRARAMADPGVAEGLADWWAERLRRWQAAGVAGLRCGAPHHMPPAFWARLIRAVPELRFLAWTPGTPAEAAVPLAGCGFHHSADSLAWWDGRAGWWAEEAERLALIAPAISVVQAPFGPRPGPEEDAASVQRAASRRLRIAAGFGCGLLVPMGFEIGARHRWDPARDRPGDWDWDARGAAIDLSADLKAANAVVRSGGAPRALTGAGATAVALFRADAPDVRIAPGARLVLANPDVEAGVSVPVGALLASAGGGFGRFRPLWPQEGPALEPGATVTLGPCDARVYVAEAAEPIRPPAPARGRGATATGPMPEARPWTAEAAAAQPRVAIEAVAPAVDDGRFAVKRIVGEVVQVEADLICDGHDKLAAAVQWRPVDQAEWREVRMRPLANDRWVASFPLERMGRHVFRVEAWKDAFATFRDELSKKHGAGLQVGLELEEGRLLVARAAERAGEGPLAGLARQLEAAGEAERLTLLLEETTAALMAAADDRPHRVRSADHPVEADRREARFASWYELFPRSQSGDPKRHGTFADVERRLPEIRAMGFDVLYFPPIHPIGRTHRKGRNNSLTPGPDDPGSPYAIGSEEGGHDAIHPQLGTLEDFRRLLAAARAHGLEVALDFAIQCSPDHPWLREHKDWFAWRPDGSLRYAENPPKKYEDIVNVEFYAEGAVPALWQALRDVVCFWADQGVRTFRVDNPHTKPLPFWEWLIADIRARYPDCLFLSEAFTRPKMMYRLAKLGFNQSYTYFTWRNHKQEITEYLTELTTTAPKDFFRPNFFVNTPDINPYFLQSSGRPGFLIRAALATTLSGLWGMTEGFELCEGRAVPGKEEYLDSEKYEIRAWDRDRPGNIKAEIARLNAIRRTNPALQDHMGLAFHNAFDDAVLWYRKATPDRSNVLLVAVSLDPHAPREATVELPLWEWGLPDHASLEAEDLMHGHRFAWHGKHQRIRLDPAHLPFGIWRVRPAVGSDRA